MAFSAFDDKNHEPSRQELESVLGDTSETWDQLISRVGALFDPLAEDWVFSGKQWGWALRLKHRKRAVLYMTPHQGSFHVGLALGKKAAAAALRSDLPEDVVNAIDDAQDYAEGKAVRLEVRSVRDTDSMVELAKIKMAN